jgi:hypothetical protein
VQPEDPYDDYELWTAFSLARTRVTGAPLWSQAWRWGTMASAWWPGFYPRSPAGLSPKRRRGSPFRWAHHLSEGPKGSGALCYGRQPREGTLAV